MELSLSTLFDSEILSDLTIEFVDNHTKSKVHVHKNILYLGCSYFRSMFNRFSESNSREIVIKVPDVNASIDIIKYFYGIETTNDYWKYILNTYVCKKFFGLETEFPANITVVFDDIEEFLDFIDKMGYDDNTLKLIVKNIPESYNLQTFPKYFIKALFGILDTKYLILVFSHEIILVDIDGTTYKSIKFDTSIKGACHIQNTNKIAYRTDNIIRVYDFEKNKIVFEKKNSYTHRICSANGKLFIGDNSRVEEINPINGESYRFFRSTYDEKIILEVFYDNEFIIVFGQPHVHSLRIKTLICFYNTRSNDKIRSFYYDGNVDMLEYCPVNKCMFFCENHKKTGEIYRVCFYDSSIKIFTRKELVYESKYSKIIKIIWISTKCSLIFCCENGTIGTYCIMTNETKILTDINDKIKDAVLIKHNILAILSPNTVHIIDINKCGDNANINKFNVSSDIVKIMSTSSINTKLANKISDLLDDIDDENDDDSDDDIITTKN